MTDKESNKPYVVAKMGKHELRSVEGSPEGQHMCFPYHSEKWLRVACFRDLKLRKDPQMGRVKVDLESLVALCKKHDQIYSARLVESKGGPAVGEMTFRLSTTKESVLEASVAGAEKSTVLPKLLNDCVHIKVLNVKNVNAGGKKLQPYFQCRVGAEMVCSKASTDITKDVAYFSETFAFPYTGGQEAELTL